MELGLSSLGSFQFEARQCCGLSLPRAHDSIPKLLDVLDKPITGTVESDESRVGWADSPFAGLEIISLSTIKATEAAVDLT